MVRAVAFALTLSACVYDYDGAFTESASSGGSASGGSGGTGASGGAGASGGGLASGAGGEGGSDPTVTTTTDSSTSTGMPCVCAPPGACDGSNVCVCPASVVAERYPAIGEGTNGGNAGWTDVGFITAPDGSAAFVQLGNNQASEQLTARGYDFSEIPNDATILGIRLEIDRCRTVEASPVDVQDTYLRLVSAGNVVGAGPSLGTWGNCGGPGGSYEFPVAGISPAQLKNDFGAQLRIKNFQTGTATGYVNSLKMTVTYQPTCAP